MREVLGRIRQPLQAVQGLFVQACRGAVGEDANGGVGGIVAPAHSLIPGLGTDGVVRQAHRRRSRRRLGHDVECASMLHTSPSG